MSVGFEASTVPPGLKQEREQGKQDNVTWRGAETHLHQQMSPKEHNLSSVLSANCT